jgi:hypothetical protein
MAFVYQSGEEVKSGDRVTYHGEPGEVEFVHQPNRRPRNGPVRRVVSRWRFHDQREGLR